MSANITEATAQSLRNYSRDIKGTPSEIGKRERFSALLGELFGGAREVGIYAKGGETSLRITTSTAQKRGQAETVFGSAVIEFEKNLKQTQAEADRQLGGYENIWCAYGAAFE